MIIDSILDMVSLYNDAHGFTKEIDKLRDFLMELDDDILNASIERQEKFVEKYLEIHGR